MYWMRYGGFNVLHKDLGLAILTGSMNVLEVNGEKYVKASSLARELGYTADYIGQLCRAGKVSAQLVGRSWYVSETSLRAHKKNRYRSNKNKTQAALQKDVATAEESTSKKKLPEAVVAYHQDDADLMPAIEHVKVQSEEKSVAVPISAPPPPQRLNIAAQSRTRHYRPIPKSAPVFKGRVAVEEFAVVEEVIEEVPEPKERAPEPAPMLPIETAPEPLVEGQLVVTAGDTDAVATVVIKRSSVSSRVFAHVKLVAVATSLVLLLTLLSTTVLVAARVTVTASGTEYTSVSNYSLDTATLLA